jgi:hypothetical protein
VSSPSPAALVRPRRLVPALGLTMAQLWAVLIPAAVLLFLLGRQVTFIDLGYHLRAGMWEWQHHHWLDHDIFTSTFRNEPWLNENWLAQILLYGMWRFTGYTGLVALNAALYSGGFLLLFRVCARRVGDLRLAGLAALVAVAPAILNTLVRPQALSWFLLAIVVWLLEDAEAHPERCMWIIPLTALWANLHGGFIIGLLFLAITTVVALVRKPSLAQRGPRFLLLATVGSFLAALVNPWGIGVYPYVLSVGGNPIVRRFIDEWQPPVLSSWAGGLFFASLFVVVVALTFSSIRLRAVDLIRLAVGAVLGLMAIRNGLWWSMAAAPALATLFIPLRVRFAKSAANDRPKRVHWIVIAFVIALLVLASPWTRSISPLIPSGERNVVASSTPTRAAAYLHLHPVRGNMFNSQAFGSYFEWALPEVAPFIDSRIEMFSPQLWSDYTSVMTTKPGWQRIMRRRDIGYAVIARTGTSYLDMALRRSPQWSSIYSDRGTDIFRFDGPH